MVKPRTVPECPLKSYDQLIFETVGTQTTLPESKFRIFRTIKWQNFQQPQSVPLLVLTKKCLVLS